MIALGKNIIFYFSDQQRWDTINEQVTPNLMTLAKEGMKFNNNFTCQPVCGPARACIQSGVYATQNGCVFNGIALPEDTKTIAHYFKDAGYQTAYIGKWHLASDRFQGRGLHCEKTAVPESRQGGYDYWRAADVLEFTSDSKGGYVFDENGNKLDFEGYRSDCINDFALEFIENRDKDKPFFMFVSQLEPHHQNTSHHFEGHPDTVADFKDYPIPSDIAFLRGDYNEEFPDYMSACQRLDYNVGQLVAKLKELGIYEDTVIVYTSDHGCHFKTRNLEYKRSCHESATHTPLIIRGGKFVGGEECDDLSSLIDIPPTLLAMAGIKAPDNYMGDDLAEGKEKECVFMQISEGQIGRAIRTKQYKYCIQAPGIGYIKSKAKVYFEAYLYDLKKDPDEKTNLVKDSAYNSVRADLKKLMISEMIKAGESKPVILPAIIENKR